MAAKIFLPLFFARGSKQSLYYYMAKPWKNRHLTQAYLTLGPIVFPVCQAYSSSVKEKIMRFRSYYKEL